MDKSNTETVVHTWRGLFKVGGVAALIIAVMYLLACPSLQVRLEAE